MSTEHIMQTGIEVIITILLLYGFFNEEAVINFEQNVKRIVKGHYRRFKRKLKQRIKERKARL
ncbi:MAG: hypothetical protein IKL46_04735 [Clostridia bacterium]|nr:hypothetical protein [Clostridia bacterium]